MNYYLCKNSSQDIFSQLRSLTKQKFAKREGRKGFLKSLTAKLTALKRCTREVEAKGIKKKKKTVSTEPSVVHS